jgi:hypothetical protein
MLKPTNYAAEEIVRLRSINADLDVQANLVKQSQEKNLDSIAALDQIATWEEVPDVVIEEPVVVDTAQEPVVIPEGYIVTDNGAMYATFDTEAS